jgi:mitochondrial fission protein ELM1
VKDAPVDGVELDPLHDKSTAGSEYFVASVLPRPAADFSNKISGSRNTVNGTAAENVTWVITDGRAGILNQARGLAEAVGLPVEVKTVRPRLPWTLLPLTWWPAPFAALGSDSARFEPPWPRLAIGCGWRSIPYLIALKRVSYGKTFTVQLQHPRVASSHFDLVVPPEHDELTGGNVIPIIGSPNGVTREKLDAAAAKWSAAFERLPRPRIAVLIGGKSRSHSFNEDDARTLAATLKTLMAQGHGVMATTSRRTGEAQTRIIRDTLAGPNAFVWDGTSPNPLLGLLALADAILATSDSTNMAVEAAATGKPLYIVDIPGGGAKFDRLHESLKTRGIARKFTGKIEHWTYEPLNETARVAELIRRRIGL